VHGLEDSIIRLRDVERELQSEVDAVEIMLQQQSAESCRQLAETQIQLQAVRTEVAECDTQYTATAERIQMQFTTREAARLKDERSSNKKRGAREQQLKDLAATMAANEAELAGMLLHTQQVRQSHDEHQDALREIVLSCQYHQGKHDAEIAAAQHKLDNMCEQLAARSSDVLEKGSELAKLNCALLEKQVELRAVEEEVARLTEMAAVTLSDHLAATPVAQAACDQEAAHRSENTQDADDAFETMLQFISDDTATECNAQILVCYRTIQTQTLTAQAQTLELAGQLTQTSQDLQATTGKLVLCRAEGIALVESNYVAQAAVRTALLKQNDLLLETQSSIDLMGENKHTLLRSIYALRASRDEHSLKLRQIHCHGNTVDLAMTELRSSMRLRHSSPEFQIKIETVLDLFGNFLDWFEGTFTVVLYDFTCVLQNSRVE